MYGLNGLKLVGNWRFIGKNILSGYTHIDAGVLNGFLVDISKCHNKGKNTKKSPFLSFRAHMLNYTDEYDDLMLILW